MRPVCYGRSVLSIAILLFLDAPTVEGAEIFVDSQVCPSLGSGTAGDPFCTVQDGVEAASSGDTVHVATGIYESRNTRTIDVGGFVDTIEAVLFLKDGVQVAGSGPGASVLDGGGSATVVVADRCGSGSSLTGLTLRRAGPGSTAGFDFGDGLFVNEGSPTVADVDIESVEGGFAALDIFGLATPVIEEVLIHDNGQIAPLLAAIWISGGGAPTLRSIVVHDNHGTAAGGLFVEGADVSVINSVIASNQAGDGGGIRMSGSVASSVSSSTIVGNTSGVAGAGIRLESSSPLIRGCLVVSNVSLVDQAGGIYLDGGSDPILEHNDVFGNARSDYQTHVDPTGTDGNISQDPLFHDFSADDFRLSEGSPAIDSSSPLAPSADALNVTRPLDGDRNGSAEADIGAFEFNRWDVGGLSIGHRAPSLRWTTVPEAFGYYVYRGEVRDLREGDYGDCITILGELTEPQFDDVISPLLNEVLFYVVTAGVDAAEGTFGYDAFGLERIPQPGTACP